MDQGPDTEGSTLGNGTHCEEVSVFRDLTTGSLDKAPAGRLLFLNIILFWIFQVVYYKNLGIFRRF